MPAPTRPTPHRRHTRTGQNLSTVEILECRSLLAANVFKTISIDGNMGDWAGVPAYFDAEGNTHDTDHTDPNDTPAPVNHPDVDLLEYKVAYDSENIYFYFRSKGEIGRTQVSTGPGVASGRYYAITTIDVDQDNLTGYELSEGGYYPTSNGYDVNAEVEYYNGVFNTAHYLNHGATDQTELEQAFHEQSSGLWTPGNDGPYPAGFMTVKPGIYDTYTQWVYHENDTLTFVRDKGPIVNGIASQFVSPDGHSMEMKFPYRGFLKDVSGNSIVGLGATLDISFSLEASSELSPDHQWASNTAVPVVGFHLNAPSRDSVSVYRNGKFYVDQNNDSAWNGGGGGANDVIFNFGIAGDRPIAGDWNADGFDDVGVFRNGNWYLDTNADRKWNGTSQGDVVFSFGTAGDLPVAGDWNRDGRDDAGVFRSGKWYLDLNGNHRWDGPAGGDGVFSYGNVGDKPVVGDWNGDGFDDLGVVRQGKWYLDQNGNHLWNGIAGGDQIISFGNPNDIPVVGDWNDDNISDIGAFRGGEYFIDRNGNRMWNGNSPSGDLAFKFGSANDLPLGGRWIKPRVLNTAPPSSGFSVSPEPATASNSGLVSTSDRSDSVRNEPAVVAAGGHSTSPAASLMSSNRKLTRTETSGNESSSRHDSTKVRRNPVSLKAAGESLPVPLVDLAFAKLL